jgi:DMSO/TMAO reductase YedYZ molybdopterin-dependent catalytic subunit
MSTQRVFVALTMLVTATLTAPISGAEPQSGITVAGPSHTPVNLSLEELAQLPITQVETNFLTENGPHSASFEGPLLWAVLQRAGVVDPAKRGDQVSQTIVILGRDGYRAVLALAEVAPEFEAKQVILAERMDGKPLDAEHLRVVVPLDKRGGRSVRDVASIEVIAPSTAE